MGYRFLLFIVLQAITDYHLWQVSGTGLALGRVQHLTTGPIYNCVSAMSTSLQNRRTTPPLASWHEYRMAHEWLMSFKRHLCQTKVIVLVIVLDTHLVSDLGGFMYQVCTFQFADLEVQPAQASAVSQASVCTRAASQASASLRFFKCSLQSLGLHVAIAVARLVEAAAAVAIHRRQ